MNLTNKDKMIMETIADIGRTNTSMKQVADRLDISYGYLMRRKVEIAHNNGYKTFTGFLVDYTKEKCACKNELNSNQTNQNQKA